MTQVMAPPENVVILSPQQEKRARTKKLIVGVLLVIAIAVSVCGAGQFAKSTYRKEPYFNAPFFINWFNACGLMVCYPIYILVMLLNCRRKESIAEIWQRSLLIYGSGGLTVKTLFTHVGFFSFLGLATNYAYIRSLGQMNPSNVTAVFAANPVFVFLLSCVFLKSRAISLKLIAVALAVTGVVLISYSAEGFNNGILIGVSLALLAALGAAIYTVRLKGIVGNATPDQVALFLSFVAAFSALVFWPIILILHYTGTEQIVSENIPWDIMTGSCGLGVIFNFLINFGVAYTYPLFAAFGGVVAVPLNYVTDSVFRDFTPDAYKIIGSILVVLSFIIIVVLPEKLDDRFYAKVTGCRRREPQEKQAAEEMEKLKHRNEA